MFEKLKSILGNQQEKGSGLKTFFDPYDPEGTVSADEHPVTYALLKRASRISNELKIDVDVDKIPEVKPFKDLSECARSAAVTVVNLTLENSYRELGKDQFNFDAPNIQDRAVVYAFGMLMLYAVLTMLENDGIEVTDKLVEVTASLCKTMNMFMSDEHIAEVHIVGKPIFSSLSNTDHENAKQLISGIETMTIALIHNEVQKKTDDADIEKAITGLLKSLYRSFD